jgi:hypothetical protein
VRRWTYKPLINFTSKSWEAFDLHLWSHWLASPLVLPLEFLPMIMLLWRLGVKYLSTLGVLSLLSCISVELSPLRMA